MVGWEILNCKKCGLYKTRSRVVIGRGNPAHAKILLIGEGPGQSEDMIGRAFVGEAGIMLDQILNEAAINIDACFFTNCVLCRPCDEPMGPNRVPTKAEVMACRENVQYIISQGNFLGTILLGKEANKYFKSLVKSKPFVHIIHPSKLAQEGGKFSSWYQYTINELQRFKERIYQNGTDHP